MLSHKNTRRGIKQLEKQFLVKQKSELDRLTDRYLSEGYLNGGFD